MPLTKARAEARAYLSRAADRSRRFDNVAYSPDFMRTADLGPDAPSPVPPLARLIQGGRGGETRLKLYLLLTMSATQKPFDIKNPPTPGTFARTLDLSPETGPRRITSNLRWLAKEGFLSLTKRPGLTSSIQLLDPRRPDRSLPDQRGGRYVTIPLTFWSQGWLIDLSPTGIAVLFALAEALGGYDTPRYLLRDRRDSYGLSHDTWTRGRHELEEHQLLTVTRTPQGSDFDYRRLRNSYWLNLERLDAPPAAPDVTDL